MDLPSYFDELMQNSIACWKIVVKDLKRDQDVRQNLLQNSTARSAHSTTQSYHSKTTQNQGTTKLHTQKNNVCLHFALLLSIIQ